MRLSFFCALLTLSPLAAQTAFVTGVGYTPPSAFVVAPGQVTTFYVGGLSQTVSALQSTTAVVSIGGVSQPAAVLSAKATDASTVAITALIPFTLVPGNSSPVTIQFSQSGTVQTAPVSLIATAVLPHIINTCDVLYSAATTNCQLAITHQDGTLVTNSSPAKSGEVLTVWALGLGVPASGVPGPTSGPIAMSDIQLHTLYSEMLPRTAPVTDLSNPYQWAGLSSPQTGLYQINFAVPPPPIDVQPCSGSTEWFAFSGNLSVSVFRPTVITSPSAVTSGEGFAFSTFAPISLIGPASICVTP